MLEIECSISVPSEEIKQSSSLQWSIVHCQWMDMDNHIFDNFFDLFNDFSQLSTETLEIGCSNFVPSEEIKQSSSLQRMDMDNHNFNDVAGVLQEIQQDSESEDDSDINEMLVPPEIHSQLCTYIENSLVPDIKNYMKGKYPKIKGVLIEHFPFERLKFYQGSYSRVFDGEQHYCLDHTANILESKNKKYSKFAAREQVGAAIRFCKNFGKGEHADRIIEIVKDSFTPDEHLDYEGSLFFHLFNDFIQLST